MPPPTATLCLTYKRKSLLSLTQLPCWFDHEFLSSFNLSWSFALRKPTWRDILRHQYMNGTVRNQELLESTLTSMSTLCQKLSSGLTRECSITLPSVKGTDDVQVKESTLLVSNPFLLLAQLSRENPLNWQRYPRGDALACK